MAIELLLECMFQQKPLRNAIAASDFKNSPIGVFVKSEFRLGANAVLKPVASPPDRLCVCTCSLSSALEVKRKI
jgi:hypothetical protein